MMKRVALGLVLLSSLLFPATAFAQSYDPFSNVCSQNGDVAVCDNDEGRLVGSDNIFIKVTSIIAIVAGIAAVLMLTFGGFRYIMSAGDPQKINTAKNTILYSIIGIVVVAAAQGIILFVIDKV